MADAACRVLVVDDTPHIRALLADFLGAEGFEVRTAADGREALGVLAGWRPDLIVLDLAMPVMDGRAFRSAQLDLEELAGIPVLVFSANADREADLARAHLARFRGHDPR